MRFGRRSIVGLVLAIAVSVVAVIGGSATPARADCPNVQLIFVRGTNEPPGLGAVGDALFAALQPSLGQRAVDNYAVNYPASYNFLQTADGANDARDHIAAMADQCPATHLVLGGFSQGAAAVSMLAGVPPLGNTVGEFGLAAGTGSRPGQQGPGGRHVRQSRQPVDTPLSTTKQFAGRAIGLCSPGDPVCVVGGRDRDAHHNYSTAPYPDEAASFIAGRV
ncbi:cutinase family protein [Mycobacterium tilburgii]|uniref:cutinase family protein n=1 Tax=Mycobacterium tilburgii TaxID=44467 RepID=UPI0021B22F80|nr:cutinase family protein [Mycobacterium tilburgii]